MKKKEIILNGLEYIKNFTEDFKHVTSDELSLSKNIDSLLSILNNVLKYKDIERYRILKIFGSQMPDMTNLLETIINILSFIRGVSGKFKYSSKYTQKSFCISADKLDLIYQLEYQYHEALFSFLNQWRNEKNE